MDPDEQPSEEQQEAAAEAAQAQAQGEQQASAGGAQAAFSPSGGPADDYGFQAWEASGTAAPASNAEIDPGLPTYATMPTRATPQAPPPPEHPGLEHVYAISRGDLTPDPLYTPVRSPRGPDADYGAGARYATGGPRSPERAALATPPADWGPQSSRHEPWDLPPAAGRVARGDYAVSPREYGQQVGVGLGDTLTAAMPRTPPDVPPGNIWERPLEEVPQFVGARLGALPAVHGELIRGVARAAANPALPIGWLGGPLPTDELITTGLPIMRPTPGRVATALMALSERAARPPEPRPDLEFRPRGAHLPEPAAPAWLGAVGLTTRSATGPGPDRPARGEGPDLEHLGGGLFYDPVTGLVIRR
jgi:hypothetical protein